eukprot:TRINITY_DN16181_c0_g4_i1.p1 TRINITY_DN16181_c0_g4~~TRINITY_DN16181_c0_g4_i1.p1  ORF type:complete len:200 (-),score=23.70 TRINITY_DN16181_c0_g4_i1:328-882(-)
MVAFAERLETLGLLHLQDQVERSPVCVDHGCFDHVLTCAELRSIYTYPQPGKGEPDINLSEWLPEPRPSCASSPAGEEGDIPQELGFPACAATQRLWRLNRTVDRLREALGSGADWVGIYRTVDSGQGHLALLKEAYRGSDSRGLFPLTEDFARGSNNSTCALRRRATVVRDTLELGGDQPYFE